MKEYIGIYSVNNKIYTDKIEAILEANKTNADITWNFHNDEFKKTFEGHPYFKHIMDFHQDDIKREKL